MSHCKGRIVAVQRCGSCLEVVVAGECPGAFPIDNCCAAGILDIEGSDWIGRAVEYEDGFMRFLDHAPPTPPPASSRR